VAFNDRLGQPQVWSGASGVVFKISCPQTGKTWAVKCFTRSVPNQARRYGIVSDCLQRARLPFGVVFAHLEKGMLLTKAGTSGWYPILKMEWAQGQALNEFVADQLDKAAVLDALATMWVKMASLV
jgi:hypothetical protein